MSKVSRRRAPQRRGIGAAGKCAVLVMTALLVAGLLGAATVTLRARTYAERADRDLRAAALDAGFAAADDVHVSYPFLIERLGLTSRNEEPFPYGYAMLDLELGGCRLRDVSASLLPDTRSWLPHPVSMRNIRFEYDYFQPTTNDPAGVFHRVEFKDAAQLLTRLESEDGPAGVRAVVCQSVPNGQQGPRGTGPAHP